MNNPKTLISLLNWKTHADTIKCIEQLLAIGINVSNILVTDNASPNNSVDRIKNAFPDIEIICSQKNNGFAAGHKIAADIAIARNFDFIWILNSDLHIQPNTLQNLLQAYQRHGMAVYGSVSVSEHDNDRIDFGGAYEVADGKIISDYNIYKGKSITEKATVFTERQVAAVEGHSMLIPIELIKKYGFMDTRFFMYGEETEYCIRIMNAGIPSIIVPDSLVIHNGEGSFGTSGKHNPVVAYYRARNYRLIAKKHFGLTNREIFKSVGGAKALFVFFLLWPFRSKQFKTEKQLDYFHNLGILHALFNIRGKRVKPENYL